MNRRAIQLILVAALVAIAGCAGGTGGNLGSDSPTDDSSTMDSSDGGTGTAAFYVSDEPNVIDDFEHLNVTITKVGFKKIGAVSDGDANETDGNDSESESDDGNESTDETSTGDANEENETDGEERDGDDAATGEEEDETEVEDDDGGNDEEWIERDVDSRTVDLTELKGANASMVDEFGLPAGDYEKVFIYVSDTEGILTDGSETTVKLPSNKLQLNTGFTVGDGERVDFVYDIAPHKAGKSGKYILKPVISQSGTSDEQEIVDIDEKRNEEAETEDENEDEEETEDEEQAEDEAEQKADDEDSSTQN